MTEKERAKKLASEHWGYVAETLAVHGVQEEELQIIRHHYETAMVHGYGHGAEDTRNGMFRPQIGEPLTEVEISDISRPCTTCLDEKPCGGGMRHPSGDCLHHRPKVADQQHPKVATVALRADICFLCPFRLTKPMNCNGCCKFDCAEVGG